MHQVAVLFSLADKTKPWTGVARACVEHPHLFLGLRCKCSLRSDPVTWLIDGCYCQTPSPVQNWELTLLSLCNKNKKNNPHLISGCLRRLCKLVAEALQIGHGGHVAALVCDCTVVHTGPWLLAGQLTTTPTERLWWWWVGGGGWTSG